MDKKNEKAVYFSLAAAMALILLAPGWALDKFLFGLDTFTLHLPFLIYAKKAWAVFHSLPVWMPDIYMGMPAIDAANLMFFYPTNLLFVILPVPVEQTYLIDLIIHIAAAGLGMFLFLRRHHIEKQAAYFGAFVYVLSGPFLTGVYNGHWNDIKAMALAPFVFYFMNRAVKEKAVFFYLSAGLFMALQVLGIGMQIAAYTCIGALIYAAYLLFEGGADKKEILTALMFFAVMIAAAALFSAPQFFPSRDYMNFSWRREFPYSEFIDHSFNPAESIVFLLPNFFGLKDSMYWGFFPGMAMSYYCGLLPFLLAPFALLQGKHRNISVFFAALAVFFALLAFGGYTQLYRVLYHVPVFNKFRNPASALCLFPFALSFLAAAGLSAVTGAREENKRVEDVFRKVFMSAAAASAVFLLAITGDKFLKGLISIIYASSRAGFTNQPMAPENLSYIAGLIRTDVAYFVIVCAVFSLVIYLALKNKLRPAAAISVIFCLLQFFDLQRVENKFISYETIKNTAPADEAAAYMKNDKTVFRYADLNFAWTINRNMYHGLESLIGFHAILHGKMYSLMENEAFSNINIMRLFNVKYYINTGYPKEYETWGLKEVVPGAVRLYEDPHVLPRVFLTDKALKFRGDDEILAYMKTPAFDPMTALVKDEIIPRESKEPLSASAVITEYSPDRINIEASANKEAVLVLSNMFYHRWKAKIDDTPVKIYNVDYALTGVQVPSGRHKILFYYDAVYIVFYMILALLSLLGYAGAYLTYRKKKA